MHEGIRASLKHLEKSNLLRQKTSVTQTKRQFSICQTMCENVDLAMLAISYYVLGQRLPRGSADHRVIAHTS